MRFWGMVVFGVLGTAILLSLGIWQLQRLAWKQEVLRAIESKILAPAVKIPQTVLPDAHSLLPVRAEGRYKGDTVRVLVSQKIYGAGYRLITAFELVDGRTIMLDRGFTSVRSEIPSTPQGRGQVIGNLQWPQEIDSFTPENDLAANIWFARDVARLAEHLKAEPVLLVLRDSSFETEAATPLPKMTANIPNDHMNYAITWFSLALIWLGMSGYFLYRSRDPQS
ncbi:SURF1 family protein [uncultured Planktomarina sp.]|uniref:SURF1 family protein n=1 Tax=uncultured Planktomarina sp. TaxID=1538529 RepID=UPI003260F6E9